MNKKNKQNVEKALRFVAIAGGTFLVLKGIGSVVAFAGRKYLAMKAKDLQNQIAEDAKKLEQMDAVLADVGNKAVDEAEAELVLAAEAKRDEFAAQLAMKVNELESCVEVGALAS